MAIKTPELISGVKNEIKEEKKLTYKNLKSEEAIDHIKRVLTSQEDETLTYYIHNERGAEYLGSYQYTNSDWAIFTNKNKIEAINHNEFEISFIENIFKTLDPIIDLDFRRMDTYDGSALDIYSATSIDDGKEPDLLGMSINQSSNMGSWWDIIWLDTDNKETNNDNDLNTIIHEIGHSLGLSHPFDEPKNELWSTKDTVMSYNMGPDGWNTWFSKLDILALQSIWGRENDQGFISIDGLSSDFEFTRTKQDKFNLKGEIGVEEITYLEKINFLDQSFLVKEDIKDTFSIIKGVDDITGQLFRLYNTIFDRFPDINGFKYWIGMNELKLIDLKETTELFISSDEFSNKNGFDISDGLFINQLYLNAFDRSPELEGFQYWMNQLESNLSSRTDVALSINNSHESRFHFMENTSTTFLETIPKDIY